eukprot:CAMPEP_0204566278 /NCGR_PEP_ID=MMETSP0661-20131031/35964_1 /ASSEMBLY_ACC=CAM_ASM_000606 /TAXON_ID=109239 /ORGANISM="Alexandrium margalefi, Strain AMGDE01CS-322" /LENGTH=111 /DNA_ID=CAMNT_0051574117 /DNA_START=67 /DNA_END=403 /DNA_ORIENTATION=-
MGGGNGEKSKRAREDAAKKAAAQGSGGGGGAGKDKRTVQPSHVCTICKQAFPQTQIKGAQAHVESKHSKSDFATCFPGFTAEEAAFSPAASFCSRTPARTLRSPLAPWGHL